MKKVMKDMFLKLMFNILKSYTNFIMIYHFYQKEYELGNESALLLKKSLTSLNTYQDSK